jgi:hypothetical protein
LGTEKQDLSISARGGIGLATIFVADESLMDLLQMITGYFQREAVARQPSDMSPVYLYFTKMQFPFKIIHGMFLVAIFYLMVNLYHRSVTALRYYAYLGALESEIRTHLGFDESKEKGFTRESLFYWRQRPYLLRLVKYFYIFIIGGMLGLFYFLRVGGDFVRGDRIMLSIDILVGIPTALIFLAYMTQSVSLDSPGRAEKASAKR